MPGFSGDGGPATLAEVNQPSDIEVDDNGNVYIADSLNHRVRRIDANTGMIETIAGNGTSDFAGDDGLAVDAALWYAELVHRRKQENKPKTGAIAVEYSIPPKDEKDTPSESAD